MDSYNIKPLTLNEINGWTGTINSGSSSTAKVPPPTTPSTLPPIVQNMRKSLKNGKKPPNIGHQRMGRLINNSSYNSLLQTSNNALKLDGGKRKTRRRNRRRLNKTRSKKQRR